MKHWWKIALVGTALCIIGAPDIIAETTRRHGGFQKTITVAAVPYGSFASQEDSYHNRQAHTLLTAEQRSYLQQVITSISDLQARVDDVFINRVLRPEDRNTHMAEFLTNLKGKRLRALLPYL